MPAIFIVAVVVVGLFAYLSYARKQQRITDCRAWAASHGFTYQANNTDGLDRLAFQLLKRGDGRGFDNVMVGSVDGHAVALADFWYYDESTDSKGHTSRTTHTFSVAFLRLPVNMPWVEIKPEGVMSWLADRVGLHDIDFESGEFNNRFNVKASDRSFAFKLIDALMMEWLLAARGLSFEVGGSYVLMYGGRVDPPQFGALLTDVNAFVGHIPRLVFSDYGTGAA